MTNAFLMTTMRSRSRACHPVFLLLGFPAWTGRVPTSRKRVVPFSVVQKQSCFSRRARPPRHSAHALVGRHESFRQRAVQRPRRHDGQGGVHGGHERGTRRRTGTSRLRRDGLILHCFPRAVGTPRVSRPARPRLPATRRRPWADATPRARAMSRRRECAPGRPPALPSARAPLASASARVGGHPPRRPRRQPRTMFQTDPLSLDPSFPQNATASRRGHQPRVRGRASLRGAAPARGRRRHARARRRAPGAPGAGFQS